MKTAVKRVPYNLRGPDAVLAEKLRKHLEKKHGRMTAVGVARIALRLLAEREGL